jgi:hypothetical protein
MAEVEGKGKFLMKNEDVYNQLFMKCFNAIREVKWRPRVAIEIHKVASAIDAQVKLIGELHNKMKESYGIMPDKPNPPLAPEKEKELNAEFKELMVLEFELPIDKKIEITGQQCSELEIKYLGAFLSWVE